jgi:N utilization substance protein A
MKKKESARTGRKKSVKGELVEAFAIFSEEKGINREVFEKLFKETVAGLLGKKFGVDKGISVNLNADRGIVEFYRQLRIVEDGAMKDPHSEIEVSEAQKKDEDLEVGDELAVIVSKDTVSRREIMAIHQNLKQKILEYQNQSVYNRYAERIGEIITVEVYQAAFKKEVIAFDEHRVEMILPRNEQIPADNYKRGDSLRAIIHQVSLNPNGSSLQITLSRTTPDFLEHLFEQEIPEVFDGLISVKKVVREPGERAKIAVESYSDRLDPVGTCVGVKGQRIHCICRELRNESIDVINWTTNPELLITRALNPAKITSMYFDEAKKTVDVRMRPDQIALAIGKGGQNIKLAGKLAGYDINVYRDSEEDEDDVDLQEFADEIDQWMIDELTAIGCDTAKDVLSMSIEELEKRTELEVEQIEEIRKILTAEFE